MPKTINQFAVSKDLASRIINELHDNPIDLDNISFYVSEDEKYTGDEALEYLLNYIGLKITRTIGSIGYEIGMDGVNQTPLDMKELISRSLKLNSSEYPEIESQIYSELKSYLEHNSISGNYGILTVEDEALVIKNLRKIEPEKPTRPPARVIDTFYG